MAGDYIACPFLRVHPLSTPRCRIRQDPVTMAYREVMCNGVPQRCEVPELRECELRRRELERRAADRPVSLLVKLARRGRC